MSPDAADVAMRIDAAGHGELVAVVDDCVAGRHLDLVARADRLDFAVGDQDGAVDDRVAGAGDGFGDVQGELRLGRLRRGERDKNDEMLRSTRKCGGSLLSLAQIAVLLNHRPAPAAPNKSALILAMTLAASDSTRTTRTPTFAHLDFTNGHADRLLQCRR